MRYFNPRVWSAVAVAIGLGSPPINALASPLDEEHMSCGAEEAHQALYRKDPSVLEKIRLHKFKEQLSPFPAVEAASVAPANGQYVIPVVFHVVHANGAENITDSQIQEAVKQINEDYNGNDSRKDEIFDEFKSRYADVGFKFVLARKDPNGQPTDGITRHYSPAEVTQFNNGSDEQMKAKYMWPRDKYLNIYVIRSAGGQSGSAWAFYPIQVDDSHQAQDGVVSSHWGVGRSGTATPTHHKILTHEIGHWAYLAHTFNNSCSTALAEFIWGDGNFAGYGDYVNDTPATLAGSGCNKVWKPCGDSVGIANSQNYMDYGYCTMMFTEGQKQRMVNALNSPMADRNKLWTTTNLAATGVSGQAVSALFNIEKNVILPGGNITFNDVSEAEVGSVTSWQWSFPGGSPSTYNGKNPPAVTYASAGTYDVTLTVSNGSGDSNTVTKSDYIRVDADINIRNATETTCSGRFYDSGGNHPEADHYGNREDHVLTLKPNQSGQVVQVNFNTFQLQESSNCDLDSLKVFNGDSTDAPLLGTFCGRDNPGTVKAVNSSGALTFAFHSDVKAREIGWEADISCAAEQTNGQPIANANGNYLTKVPMVVEFSSKGSIDTNLGGSIVSYNWDFGDGNSSSAANPSHTYTAAGDYTVVLTITDNDGNTATSTALAKVFPENADPVAVTDGPYQGDADQWIYFRADSSYDPDGTIASYSWNFGDGNTSTEQKVWHKYASNGTYTVSLTVVDNVGLSNTTTTTATIGGGGNGGNQAPVANANGPYSADVNQAVQFSSNGSIDNDGSIASYLWTFDDGNTSTQANPSHTYSSAGTYNVTLKVTDNEGAEGQATATVTINNDGGGTGTPLPDACANGNPITSGRLNDGVVECLGAQSTIWLSMGESDAHNSVAISTGHGTGNLDVYFSNNGWPSETTATHSSTGPDNNECIYVTNLSNHWSYLKITNSGGGSSIVLDFDTPGCRTASGGGGNGSNNAPTANANGPYNETLGNSVNFSSVGSTDSDGTIALYSWDFGDGNSSTSANPTHSYSAAGNYTATLTVTDDDGATAQSTANVVIDEASGPVMCGATTLDYGGLTDGQTECVSGGRHSYWILVNDDNTKLYATTTGGTGDVNIYHNASTWATKENATHASLNAGNIEVLEVTVDSGYVYFTLDTNSSYQEVSFTVSSTAPVFGGNGNQGLDNSLSGPIGIAAADDPDCALPDTSTSDPELNLYTFSNTVDEYTEDNFWIRMRGTAVDSSYKMKFCQGQYGAITLGSRTETTSNGHLGHSFMYQYKHFGNRASNTDEGKVVVEVNGRKAIMTLSFPIQVAEVPHPVAPSCDDLTIDADFDGIPDCAEAPGKTFYNMPLYDWGARPNQIDLFIEVDYMAKHPLRDYDGNYVRDDQGNLIIDHGTEPKRATLDRVKEVYLERGIHVHMDVGDLFDQAQGLDPNDYDLGGGQAVPYREYVHLVSWTDNYNGRSIEIPGMEDVFMPQYFENNPERDKIFYYVLFANSQGGSNRGSSGQAPDLLDRYMYLSMGGTGWSLTDDTVENTNRLVNAQASTFVHELGHILGLSHDGFPDANAQNFKLNYPSVMNYLFQLQGGPTDKFADIDYETMVRERYYLNHSPKVDRKCDPIIRREHPDNYTWGNLVHGLSADPQDFHIGYSDGLQPKIIETQTSEALLAGGLDLNCDGNLNFVVGSYDVNNDGQIDQLWDHNDWGFLTFFFHYYNYDVKDQYSVSNEFLLEPNRHIKYGNSPTDAKYPGARKPVEESTQGRLKQLNNKHKPTQKRIDQFLNHLKSDQDRAKVKLPSKLGVQEMVMPPAFFKELNKQQNASRVKAAKARAQEKAKQDEDK